MNDENLIPTTKRSKNEARELGRKGGKRSGEDRKAKADLRKMAQQVLDGVYEDKNGNQVTGTEILIRGLVANMADPKGKNWGKAMDLLITLTSAARSEEQKKREQIELELIKAKIKMLEGGDDVALTKLDAILGNLERTALDGRSDTETKSETE